MTTSIGLIQQIESIQQSFTHKIAIGNLTDNYWDRLSHLKLYSLQRRRERYMWKILEGHVPNISGEGHSGISKLYDFTHRTGRTCSIPPLKRDSPSRIKQLREGSLKIHGYRLLNSLPKVIRNITHCQVDHFKTQLEVYLQLLPDTPLVRGYTAGRVTESNSVVIVIPHHSLSSPGPLK